MCAEYAAFWLCTEKFCKNFYVGERMKDNIGLYYLPRPGDTRVRVYVRRGPDGEVQFRLWQADFPQIFEGHQWLSHDVLARATQMYRDERNANIDPLWLYDINVARELLKQDEKENPTVQIRTTDGNS